jgi:uncharacterized membrane protein YeaQ/YmgE (transglycosylase-associated protein family)
MADIFFWILFGALAGWIASLATTAQGSYRIFGNIFIGVFGAVAGGALMHSFNERGITFSVPSLVAAVCGAVTLLTLRWTIDGGK